LERDLRALHLALVRGSPQLPVSLTLRQPGRAERVALRDQPAGRVDDDVAAKVVGFARQLVTLALGRETERS